MKAGEDALVVEGGAMRAIYTAGVLDVSAVLFARSSRLKPSAAMG